MMHVFAAARAYFGKLNPFIFGEMRGDDFVSVLDVATGGDGDRFGHLDSRVGLGDEPVIGPLSRRWSTSRIADGRVCVGPRNKSVNLLRT